MHCWPGVGDRINSYALVSYIPDPLGTFLDRLRQELVTSCVAQSHVSILPPREVLSGELAEAELAERLANFSAFRLELSNIQVFESTSVVYIGIGEGRSDLLRLHADLNDGALAFAEKFTYSPHITLAQDFPPEELDRMREISVKRWAEYRGDRGFDVRCLTFVQNTERNRWYDLRNFCLRDAELVGARR